MAARVAGIVASTACAAAKGLPFAVTDFNSQMTFPRAVSALKAYWLVSHSMLTLKQNRLNLDFGIGLPSLR